MEFIYERAVMIQAHVNTVHLHAVHLIEVI